MNYELRINPKYLEPQIHPVKYTFVFHRVNADFRRIFRTRMMQIDESTRMDKFTILFHGITRIGKTAIVGRYS